MEFNKVYKFELTLLCSRIVELTPNGYKKLKATVNPSPTKYSPKTGTESKPSKDSSYSKTQKRNERKKDKQSVVCTCCFTSRDRNMLFCGDCRKWQHATCYQIFGPVQLPHRCGPCAVKLDLACTSQEIKDFCMKKNKSEQERLHI